ncbi:hypothetical protein DAETH_33160 (plasmid) [Deinococcus aetherius]|uniref:Uncharacterized protein n=1 Tax=Deinococcus aetherius TaxID=200252 RepID=A0ABN6RJ12_9DEIO|nr:hypothetical protein [Deinococcus aetherius]BDP43347.1 hypothetical protein DAETH_33160 [Deinococcus aetherius]
MTIPSFAQLTLDEDFSRVQELAEAAKWNLQCPAPLEVLASLTPASTPTETFHAVLRWTDYPNEAPSVKFRDPETQREDLPRAWPHAQGFRPPGDICSNYTAEGFALHQEWRLDPNYRWHAHGNVLLKVLRTLQETLDHTFAGRAG